MTEDKLENAIMEAQLAILKLRFFIQNETSKTYKSYIYTEFVASSPSQDLNKMSEFLNKLMLQYIQHRQMIDEKKKANNGQS